jgi:hypothetical protein
MRKLLPILTFVSLVALLAVPAHAQKFQKKPTAKDFGGTVKEATADFAAKKYAAAIRKLREAMAIALEELRKQIVAAMPEAPEGFKKMPPSKQAAPAALVLNTTWLPVEQSYRAESGGGSIKVTVTADSAVAKLLGMGFAMAAHDPNTEIVEYEAHKALFKTAKRGSSTKFDLQILVYGKHVIQVVGHGITKENFFKTFSQAFVDKMAGLLGK